MPTGDFRSENDTEAHDEAGAETEAAISGVFGTPWVSIITGSCATRKAPTVPKLGPTLADRA